MQLNLNLMMKYFDLDKKLPIYIQEDKPTNNLYIRPDLHDLTKLMLSLHLFNMNKYYNKIEQITYETFYKSKFDEIKSELENIFEYLTNKRINIDFIKNNEKFVYQKPFFPRKIKFILFSGGLDSLCGLSELTKEETYLIHVITSNKILGMVRKIGQYYQSRHFPTVFLNARTEALMGGSSNTRGLVFFTFAYSISKHFENDEIFFSENGAQMLDVMLSPFAYPNKPALKNTNPIFIHKLENILKKFSDDKFNIILMNKNNTKSEMLAKNISKIPYKNSNSCFTTRGRSNMCGICYNCFLRNLSMMSIKVYEQDYECDPFLNITNKTNTYNERQRILYQMIRFYYKVIIKDSSALQELDLSSKGMFENPIELATKFGADIFLGIRNYFEMYEPTNLNALGNKAIELLSLINPDFLNQRQQYLNNIKS